MTSEFGPVYAHVRAIVAAWLGPHGYRLAHEAYTPGNPAWPAWDRGRAEFAGAGPPVSLTWDGAYHWLQLRVGEAAGAGWSVALPAWLGARNHPTTPNCWQRPPLR
jgi:hypothetical protein